MPKITLINEGVMHCRLHGIYKKMLRNDMMNAVRMIKETIEIIDTAELNELSKDTTKYYRHSLVYLLMEVAVHFYEEAHDRLRNMAYYTPSAMV